MDEVLRSSGQPLDPATREYMEPRFGHDLSQVRVHTDARAAESAREVHALAYTVGPNVVFGAEEYVPATHRGRRLLAHELAHTIQQRSPSGAAPSPAPDGVFEKSADAAGRDVANGQFVSGALPVCGMGLARALATPDAYSEQELAQEIQRVSKRLKQPGYPGRESDLDWLMRLKADSERRARLTQPSPVAPPKPPASPKLPPPDPDRERAAAVAEAQAVIASMDRTMQDEDNAGDTAPAPSRPAAPLPLRSAKEAWWGQILAEEESYKEANEARKRIDERFSKERDIAKIPYKVRFGKARFDRVYQGGGDARELTAEQVWNFGLEAGLFIESEKAAVYEDQNRFREQTREKREEASKYARHKFQTDQYNRHVAQGKQLSSPAPVLQPFAFAALSPLVGAAYAGTQTGAMAGNVYNACARGTTADCVEATAQLGATVAVNRAIAGKFREPRPTAARTTGGTSGAADYDSADQRAGGGSAAPPSVTTAGTAAARPATESRTTPAAPPQTAGVGQDIHPRPPQVPVPPVVDPVGTFPTSPRVTGFGRKSEPRPPSTGSEPTIGFKRTPQVQPNPEPSGNVHSAGTPVWSTAARSPFPSAIPDTPKVTGGGTPPIIGNQPHQPTQASAKPPAATRTDTPVASGTKSGASTPLVTATPSQSAQGQPLTRFQVDAAIRRLREGQSVTVVDLGQMRQIQAELGQLGVRSQSSSQIIPIRTSEGVGTGTWHGGRGTFRVDSPHIGGGAGHGAYYHINITLPSGTKVEVIVTGKLSTLGVTR